MTKSLSVFRQVLFVTTLFTSLNAIGYPEQLDEWREWVLDKHDDISCPWEFAQNRARVCIWPGRLVMDLGASGMRFNYQVEVFQDQALVVLPGNTDSWPMNVSANGAKAEVLDRMGVPHALLDKGKYVLAGEFKWNDRPSHLPVPESIALVELSEAGRSSTPDRRSGQVVLARGATGSQVKQQNTLVIEVFRKLRDGVPLGLETQVVLTVSGEPREVEVGRLAWPGTESMAVRSPLPARIEENGNLRVQLSPGRHIIKVTSRFLDSPDQFDTHRVGDDWPVFEYISFESDSNLRQVKLSGAPSVDTSLVPMPDGWKELPTYRLDGNSKLQLVTEYRGDQSPAANEIEVSRDLWLDFEGGALTGLELVTGSMRSDWRLNAQADTKVGSAKVSGHSVLVTEYQGAEGVEIRSPEIALKAVTRVTSPTTFSTTGWDSKVDRFSARLHTPPGWRILHASGVDGIDGTWVSKWDLWDIFLLLIIVSATRKLLGFKAAVIAVLALVAGYHERGMPIAGYAVLLLLLPLITISSGRIKRIVSVAGVVVCAGLALALVQYSIDNFRLAIYPSLERSSVGRYQAQSYARAHPTIQGMEEVSLSTEADSMADPAASAAAAMLSQPKASVRAAGVDAEVPKKIKQDAYHLGENDRVQTGPGAPTWLWNAISLRSSSPLPESSQISVSYSPPWMTRIWRVLSVLLALAYGGLLLLSVTRKMTGPGKHSDETNANPSGAAATILLVGLALAGSPQDGFAQHYPPKYLLDDLEKRLIAPPDCAPQCVSLDEGVIQTSKEGMSIGFSAYAAADVLLLLPTSREGWNVSDIQVDGSKDIAARRHEGNLAVLLTKGHHIVSVSGALEGDVASVSLPSPIHNITTTGDHWQLSGLVDGRIPSGTLSLRATSRVRQEESNTLILDPIAPFFVVSREFGIGTQWRMITRVTRLAPKQGPTSVEVPVLKFERPLTANINFKEGRALLQFADRQREIYWESTMEPMSSMQLVAAPGDRYVETWRLLPSAIWRVDYKGVPPVKEPSGEGSLQPYWKPWPGEQLDIQFTRPAGVEGPTYTVEEAQLAFQASKSIQQSTLTLKILAGIGQNYVVGLPADARVVSLSRNDVPLNLPESNRVSITLQPGEQTVAIGFEQDGEAGWISETPKVDLPGGASNITLTYSLAEDRWPLYLSGPDIGPAMLYWGVFCVIVLGAALLTFLARRLQADLPIGLIGWLLLGIGLSTVNSYGVLAVAVLFFILAFRDRINPDSMSRLTFNLMQVALAIWTIITLVTLVSAIPLGLLSSPNMIVTGNNSWSHLYNFFQDRAAQDAFPSATVLSVNLFVYRVVMLAWSLWLANRLICWSSWGWRAYSKNGVWVAKKPSVET